MPAAPVVIAALTPAPTNLDVPPKRMFVPGLPNLSKVNDKIYRGGKPNADGFRQLKAMGIHTVVDLGYHFFEVDRLKDRDLQYTHIPFYTWKPLDRQVVQFLQIAINPNSGPVYVHCRKGADRTGFMIAVYRVAVCGWSRQNAVNEMMNGGYGFDRTYQNLVDYVLTRDIPALARQAGVVPAAIAKADLKAIIPAQ
jgi:protein tyrosine/serine phosphatase